MTKTSEKSIEDIYAEVLKKQKEADSYTQAMKPVLEKGLEYVHQSMMVAKLQEAHDTLVLTGADVPREIGEIKARKEAEVNILRSDIIARLDEAIQQAELKDWLKFASQCKLDTRMYDEIDSRQQLVYDYIRTETLLDKKDLRTIQTFIARKTLGVFTEEQNTAIYKKLKAEIPNLKQRTDVMLVTKFIDSLAISVGGLAGDHELFQKVKEQYHPIVQWILDNVKDYSSYIDDTIEQLEEIGSFTLTNQRIEKYAENFIVRFELLDQVEGQKEKQELFEKHYEELQALLKSVYAEKYLGF
jgi:hypothetical protein